MRTRLLLFAFGLTTLSACVRNVADRPTVPVTEAPAPRPPAVDPELAARLETLSQRIEAARREHHVPGLSLAVVKDGEVVFAKGFGYADLKAKRPAAADTLYAVGSTTKAFTAMLAAMMVDDGKLSYDDPIAKHVPELALRVRSDDEAAQATIRDLLCHHSGFTRMSPVWVGAAVSRDEMFRVATGAEPWAEHRTKFLYNNVAYAAVGEATARVADTRWSKLLQARILEPLGMGDTTTSAAVAAKDRRLATGYQWEDDHRRHRTMPMRDLELIAPAGAINSNVVDMAKWVRFLLAKGEHEGERLIKSQQIARIWMPQVEVAPGLKYGFGWFVRSHQGARVLEHGGNIDGYAAEVALMPERGLGFVMLTNVSATPLQQASLGIVWDALLAPRDDGKPTASKAQLAPFEGTYVANFGPFHDTPFVVSQNQGRLFVDVPGQTNYELRPPGDDGRRAFAVTETIAVSFEHGADGKVHTLRMHQGGLDFEVPRKGYVPKPEVPLAELDRYKGRYREKAGEREATVVVRNNRLAVDIPGQMIFELDPPGADGRWRFRVSDDLAVSFVARRRGIRAMTLHEKGTDLVLQRAKAGPKPPTVAKLQARRRAKRAESAIRKAAVLVATGTIRMPQSGIEGTVTLTFAADERYRMHVDLGRFGQIEDVHLGDRSWLATTFSPVDERAGPYRAQARAGHPAAFWRDWRTVFAELEVGASRKVDGRTQWSIRATSPGAPPITAWVDARTGDVVESRTSKLTRGAGGIPTTTRYSDHRTTAGLRIPHRIVTRDEPSGEIVVEFGSVRRYEGDPDAAFPSEPTLKRR